MIRKLFLFWGCARIKEIYDDRKELAMNMLRKGFWSMIAVMLPVFQGSEAFAQERLRAAERLDAEARELAAAREQLDAERADLQQQAQGETGERYTGPGCDAVTAWAIAPQQPSKPFRRVRIASSIKLKDFILIKMSLWRI